MNDNIFTWQRKDFDRLCEAFQYRILFVHSNDMDSPYHVFTAFNNHVCEHNYLRFSIYKMDPNLINPLLPFLRAINEHISKSTTSKDVAQNIVKDITHSDTLAQLVANVIETGKHSSVFLSERENDIIVRFEYATKGYLPLFVFYGYPSFDSESKNLVSLLLSGQLDSFFPFLCDAKYIFLSDYEDDVETYQQIKRYEHIDIILSNPNIKDMDEIIREIAPTLIHKNIEADKIFHLAGGHLSTIELITKYLSENTHPTISYPHGEVVQIVLENRLERMGHQGYIMKEILNTAAAIGDIFEISLLKKVTKKDDICEDILRKSDQEYLISCKEEIGKFRYREVWDYFYRFICKRRLVEISLSISEAVYYFNPYDYLTRAYHLERAGKIQDACELYFLSINSFFQESITPTLELTMKIQSMSTICNLSNFWISLQNYYIATQNLDFEKGLQILENMPTVLTSRLLLLKEYLTGLCSHRAGNTLEQHQNAIAAIEKAAEYAHGKEDGIWCDCQKFLISFYINFKGDILHARAIYKDLSYFYSEKMLTSFAQKGLYSLNRIYSALYSVERAVPKTQRSVLYFRNKRYPAQYLMALNNHAANLIVLGHFLEAMEYLIEAFNFLSSYKYSSINLMYLLNNYCLCAVLLEQMNVSDAYKKLSELLECQPHGDWKVILKLNCAIYKAISGDLKEAEISLLSLERFSRELQVDGYYLYYSCVNLSTVYYLQGNIDKAVTILVNNCEEPPSLMKETEKSYLRKRTQILKEVMETGNVLTIKELDAYLFNECPQNTQWDFVGRGFLYSDIQFWSSP